LLVQSNSKTRFSKCSVLMRVYLIKVYLIATNLGWSIDSHHWSIDSCRWSIGFGRLIDSRTNLPACLSVGINQPRRISRVRWFLTVFIEQPIRSAAVAAEIQQYRPLTPNSAITSATVLGSQWHRFASARSVSSAHRAFRQCVYPLMPLASLVTRKPGAWPS
jgi:hypothetical protein